MHTPRNGRRFSLITAGMALLTMGGLPPAHPTVAAPVAAACAPVGHIIPPTAKGRINALVAPARGDVWAVGGTDVTMATSGPRTSYLGNPWVARWTGSDWQTMPLPALPAPTDKGELVSVAVFSPQDMWASGLQYPAGEGGSWSSLLLHWNGSAWAWAAPPPGAVNAQQPQILGGTSGQDMWAVGQGIAHWNGTTWQNTPIAQNRGYTLTSLVVHSSTDAWAAGARHTTSQSDIAPGIVHWDGTQWTPFSTAGLPDQNLISSIIALGPADLWVGGSFGTAHWDGATWHVVPMPPAATSSWGIVALAAHGPGEVWAAADQHLYRWEGCTWESLAGPTDTHYKTLAVEWAGDVWAAGSQFTGDGSETSNHLAIMRGLFTFSARATCPRRG